jgi:hypothetical protein
MVEDFDESGTFQRKRIRSDVNESRSAVNVDASSPSRTK